MGHISAFITESENRRKLKSARTLLSKGKGKTAADFCEKGRKKGRFVAGCMNVHDKDAACMPQ